MSDLELRDTPALEILSQWPETLGRIDAVGLAAAQDLLRVSKKLLRLFSEEFTTHGLSPGRYAALMALHARRQPMAPSDIADRLGVTRATVTGLIGGLVRDGLVAYAQVEESDRRRKAVALSAKGRKLIKRLVPAVFVQMTEVVSPLSAEERRKLVRLLNKIEASLDHPPTSRPERE